MTTTIHLDKRLRPAKIIGIILFVISIAYFSMGIMGGLLTVFTYTDQDLGFGSTSFFSNPSYWIYKHFASLDFAISIFCIPLFFASRALFKYKEWGRIVCITLLFFVILFVLATGYVFVMVRYAPLPFRLIGVMSILFCIGALCVPIYFLMRSSTKEGIRDYNKP